LKWIGMSAWLETARRKRLALLGLGIALVLALWVVSSLIAPHRDLFVEAVHRRGYPASALELDAWYLSVPPAENVALYYTNAFASLTNSSGPITNFMNRLWLPPIGQGLSAEDRSELKAVLAEHRASLRLLLAAPVTGRSRYPIHLQDGPATLLPHLAKVKQGVSLLSAAALLYATDGDAEQATRAFLAAGRLGDSLSEEPIVISQLVRYACWAILLPRLERALSVAQFTDSQLASLQRVIEVAERPQGAARGWAGEQAMHLSLYNDRKMMVEAFREIQGSHGQAGDLLAAMGLNLYRLTGLMNKDKAYFCDTMGRQLAAFELPYPGRFAANRQLAASNNVPNRLYVLSRMLLPALGNAHVRDADHTVLVRVAATALAIERFRLGHTNGLPERLEHLAPAYCRAPPADPYDGKPLRYQTHGSSYVVYSIGSDGEDDGGVSWDSNAVKIPQDVGFVVKH
jgi:hypothetical protein